ncbi:hypothetical protein BUALT_Bualt11G0127500 [Buddleja alternifolia]|uniref:Uncharacterized protein n=1 Tax=Buddleja alternifolia TaxID=168488 RepID=A0AAV6WTT0_9LAMI|nr:hypothetical protein BUALT_Bualt11G0127500 [Buddleja alternifolia]
MKGIFRISVLMYADLVVELALFEIWSMQTYLTGVWKMSFTHAAATINIWEGTTKVLQVCFMLLVDSYMGNFLMLLLSSIAYSVGLVLLFTSSSLVHANCRHNEQMCIGDAEKILFYTALTLITVGVSGHRVSLVSFYKEHLSDVHGLRRNIHELFLPFLVSTIGGFGLPYIKQWRIRFGIPVICVVAATLIFLTGVCTYEKSRPIGGSKLITVFRVVVASAFKSTTPFPLDIDSIAFPLDDSYVHRAPTRGFRFLEKAAIITCGIEEPEKNKWRLCTVQDVEEAKIVLRMAPIWMTFIACGIVSCFANTYFQEQANHMYNKIGILEVPPLVLLMIQKWIEKPCELLYDRTFSQARKFVGILVAMVCSVLCCITAAKVEMRRLGVIRSNGLVNKPNEDIPMTIFWLLPQICLLAIMNSLLRKGISDFCRSYATDSNNLSDYLNGFSEGALGLGYMCSPLLVSIVGKISEKEGGKTNWFQHALSRSRLDKYYWVMAVLCSVNLLVYIYVASTYKERDLYALDREFSSSFHVEELGVIPEEPEVIVEERPEVILEEPEIILEEREVILEEREIILEEREVIPEEREVIPEELKVILQEPEIIL